MTTYPTDTARADEIATPDSAKLAARLAELSQLDLLPANSRSVVAEAAEKLTTATVYVAVVGDFKRGKSSLINALLGSRLLPMGVVPLTSQPTLIRYGPAPCALVTMESGVERIPVDRLAEYVTEKENPGNRLKVREVWVEYPSPLLRDGVVVVDTPGTGSLHQDNTETAHAFLPRIDVGLAVLTAASPLSQSESAWLREVAARAARVVICLNKVDAISEAEREETLAYVRQGVAGILDGAIPTIFTTSARRQLESGDDPGVADLTRWLAGELARSRGGIAWDSAVRAGSIALEVAVAALELERASWEMPVAEARERERRVLEAQSRLNRVGQEGRTLITAQAADLLRVAVQAQVDAIRTDLRHRLIGLPGDYDWPQELEATAYHSGRVLESVVREPLRQVLLSQAERLQNVLDEFLAKVGSIYQIQLPAAPLLADPAHLPSIRVSVVDEPGALAMGLRTIRRAMPGAAGRSWRERARRQAAHEAADRMAGRLRYATVAAVNEAVREWLVWSESEWLGLAEALSASLRRSGEAAAAGEAAAEAQRGRLDHLTEVLAAVGEALHASPRDASDPSPSDDEESV